MLKAIPKGYKDTANGTLKLLWEEEWRALGITQVCLNLYSSAFVIPSATDCLLP